MSGFLRSSNSPVATPVYTGLQLQTSSSALPIQITYGIAKVAPNVIWAGNFRKETSSSGGGKGGGGSSKSGNSTTTYTAAVILALGEGPIGKIRVVFDNSTVLGYSYLTSLPYTATYYGTKDQTPWSALSGLAKVMALPPFLQAVILPVEILALILEGVTSFSQTEALAYPSTAYVACENANLGESATLDSYAFEFQGILATTGFNGNDADPAQVIYDFLTNPQYSVGFPAASIDYASLIGASGDSSIQSWCRAVGLAFSPALTDQESGDSILTRWLQLLNCAAFWSEGKLKFKSYGDQPVTGPQYAALTGTIGFITSQAGQSSSHVISPPVQTGTWSFTPDVTPIYDLGDDDFLDAGSDADPLTITRSDPYEAYNNVVLEILQRSNFYDATPIQVWDQNAIDNYGLRIAPTVTAHEICDATVAQTSAQMILQRGLYIRNTYQFKLSWEYCLLEPMDLVTLTDSALGLTKVAVRITTIEEDDQGNLSITAEEFPNGVATPAQYLTQQKVSNGISAGATASQVNPPVIFEPPYQQAGELAVWIALSGDQSGSYGGSNVFYSADGTTFTQIGTIDGASATGILTAPLPAVSEALSGATIDNVNTLAIDLSESAGSLPQATNADMLAGNTACYLETGEVVAYQTAALTGTDAYALSPLMRGAFDSTIAEAPVGTRFASLFGPLFKLPYTANQIGQTAYFKFQPFNTLGGGAPTLDQCAAWPYKITGSPLAAELATPQNPVIAFPAGIAELSFDEIDDFRSGIRYRIFCGTTAAAAQQVGDVAHPPFRILKPGTYWVQAYCVPEPGITAVSRFSAPVTLSGALLIANALESFDEGAAGWPGAMVNFSVQGSAPDQFLQLKSVCDVDFGSVTDAPTLTDDFGSVTDAVATVIDLGTIT